MTETHEAREARLKQSADYPKTKEILGLISNALWAPRRDEGFLSPSNKEIMKGNFAKCYEKWQDSERISAILRDLKTTDEMEHFPPESKSMIRMLAYLGLVESVGVTLMDMVLLMLIANGKDIHTRRIPAKHVETFEELQSIWELDYKLEFLDSVGISIFKDRIIKKDLRDRIAHLKFKILRDGTIQRKDDGYNTVDIDREIGIFWEGVDIIRLIFAELGIWIKIQGFYQSAQARIDAEEGKTHE
jgi:hypothetical protein